MEYLSLLPVAMAAYLIGSIPMGVLLAKVFGWPDPRTHGSGHTGAMNVSRKGGRVALAVVLIADWLKGSAAALAAPLISSSVWAIPVAGVMVIVGHCYPVWLKFNGGMGLAAGMGAVMTQSWLMVVLATATLGIMRFFIIKHTPRATIIAALCLPVYALLLQLPLPLFVMVTGVSVFIALRHIVDWNREYPKVEASPDSSG